MMIEPDTVRLLRECDAGIRMGVSSIDQVLGSVRDKELGRILTHSKNEHQLLGYELRSRLDRMHDGGKTPGAMAERMSRMKIGMKLMYKRSDSTVADLMTDGCNMGVKSLNRYLNQYAAADERSKDLTKKLIHLEQNLSEQMRDYL